jgi:hypothetical protein
MRAEVLGSPHYERLLALKIESCVWRFHDFLLAFLPKNLSLTAFVFLYATEYFESHIRLDLKKT